MSGSNLMWNYLKRGYHFLQRKHGELHEISDYIFHKNAFVFGAPYHSNAGESNQAGNVG